ncbi:MAG: hypothetical protein AL399_06270 [Candidatus [Bacteroides] periocalifornicus]|uniref:GmrSD restriction endonucleases N-terminal domain-containing protein n=1 Tax=Candidatus [Bacteroides] periocalifornicus TaxID=1702214 RepID=A0A0Q4B8E7_9BACT|nr:MAG: hypothetical protein AL399_06270 [Candidatus [Bacteroides] periocalifornicus]
MRENKVEVKAIGDLLGKHFYIPSYQRGYRWTEQQIHDLLGDIATFGQQSLRGGGGSGFLLPPAPTVGIFASPTAGNDSAGTGTTMSTR